jgi:DNA-binding Lrp family transcriptional regulator
MIPDKLDLAIISQLTKNSRQSLVELAESVGLSTTAIARRQQALEEAGIITGYRVALDVRLLGYTMTALVRITLDSQSDEALSAFENGVAKCPSVTRCFLMSGTDDYLAIVLARDIEDFERIHRMELSRLPKVARIQSSFAIREVVQRAAPLAAFEPAPSPKTRRSRRKSGA